MKSPKGVSRWPNGAAILVLRPFQSQVALALAEVAILHNSEEALREAVSQGPAKFLGFLVKRLDGVFAVDENGQNPIMLEAGDIFVEEAALEKAD